MNLNKEIQNLQNYIKGNFSSIPTFEPTWGLCDSVIDNLTLERITTAENLPLREVLQLSWNIESTIYPVENCGARYNANPEKRHDRRTKYGKRRLELAKALLVYLENQREVI